MSSQLQCKLVSLVVAMVFIVLGVMLSPTASATEVYRSGFGEPINEISAGSMVIDAIAIRPIGLASMVFGTGVFLISLPFSALAGNTEQAADMLVVKPTRYTFKRPLGEYD